jgi:hypothetical protein
MEVLVTETKEAAAFMACTKGSNGEEVLPMLAQGFATCRNGVNIPFGMTFFRVTLSFPR